MDYLPETTNRGIETSARAEPPTARSPRVETGYEQYQLAR